MVLFSTKETSWRKFSKVQFLKVNGTKVNNGIDKGEFFEAILYNIISIAFVVYQILGNNFDHFY